MAKTLVVGSDADIEPQGRMVDVTCPVTSHVTQRERTADDPPVWTAEAFDRLKVVPLVARPLARMTVERVARENEIWRVTTSVRDENRQAMIEADEFDVETMMGMFRELRAKQIRADAEGRDAMSPEMRQFIEEAKKSGVTRCPIRDLEDRDIEEQMKSCPVDFRLTTPEEAKAAVEQMVRESGKAGQ
ncbi:MAG: PCP reductase family protein [Gemmatimonadales bacterium]